MEGSRYHAVYAELLPRLSPTENPDTVTRAVLAAIEKADHPKPHEPPPGFKYKEPVR